MSHLCVGHLFFSSSSSFLHGTSFPLLVLVVFSAWDIFSSSRPRRLFCMEHLFLFLSSSSVPHKAPIAHCSSCPRSRRLSLIRHLSFLSSSSSFLSETCLFFSSSSSVPHKAPIAHCSCRPRPRRRFCPRHVLFFSSSSSFLSETCFIPLVLVVCPS